jgi:hypothetical protein
MLCVLGPGIRRSLLGFLIVRDAEVPAAGESIEGGRDSGRVLDRLDEREELPDILLAQKARPGWHAFGGASCRYRSEEHR